MKPIFWIGTAIVGLLVLSLWISLQSDRTARPAAPEKSPSRASLPTGPSSDFPPPQPVRPAGSGAMDEGVRQITAQLNDDAAQPEEDLAAIQEILNLAARAQGGHPSGENADITATLIGPGEGTFLPKRHPAVRDGELIDRWGTPYWFHPVNANTTEIRSAGPDRELFTSDDVILNDSGVTGGGATE